MRLELRNEQYLNLITAKRWLRRARVSFQLFIERHQALSPTVVCGSRSNQRHEYQMESQPCDDFQYLEVKLQYSDCWYAI
jgi:hypothetical protein